MLAAFWLATFIHEQHEGIESIGVILTAFFTATLWYSTRALQKAAKQQAKDTKTFFMRDERPWLNVRVSIGSSMRFKEDGSSEFDVNVFVKNIGKSPAFECGNGIGINIGYEGIEDRFQEMRMFTERQSYSKGKTIFPDDEDSWNTVMMVSKSDIEASQSIERGIPSQYLTIAYAYKSNFSDDLLETIRMYKFGVGPYFEGALPSKPREDGNNEVKIHLWKELVS